MRVAHQFDFEGIQGFKFGYHPFGQPNLFVHVYYIDGLLIDTGQQRMAKEVFEKLKGLPVEQMFITHHHEDHSGNIDRLARHFDCPVYSSSLCRKMMKAPPAISPAQKVFWGDRPACDLLQTKEGLLETQRFQFQLIPIPGHAPDMLALYEPNKGWMFSADLFVYHYILYFLAPESTWDQIESIRRILTYDFEILLCSHNPQFKMGQEGLRKKLQYLEDFYGAVANEYHKGYSAKEIFRRLALKEKWFIKMFSLGSMSRLNMVKSVIRDEERKK